MKAITLWQPWASLVAVGEKKVETRCWDTKYRGLLAIHSAKLEPRSGLGVSREKPEFARLMIEISNRYDWRDFYWKGGRPALGSVLCLARLVDVIPVERVRDDLSKQELTFGNYEDGRFAWFLEAVTAFEDPIPAKGNRLLWNWNPPPNSVKVPLLNSPVFLRFPKGEATHGVNV